MDKTDPKAAEEQTLTIDGPTTKKESVPGVLASPSVLDRLRAVEADRHTHSAAALMKADVPTPVVVTSQATFVGLLKDLGIRLTSRKFLLTLGMILLVVINALKANISGFSAMQLSTVLVIAYTIVEGVIDVSSH